MLRTVVLEHTLPDGSAHFDWMIEHPDLPHERPLLTWRTADRPDRADAFVAEAINPHRALYLCYEGPLSGGRGHVRRVASGRAEWIHRHDDSATVRIRWSDGAIHRYEGRREGERWRFVARPDSDSTPQRDCGTV